jgi:7,8-dihydropterin-6-yl-methyl-4-(beta-D-ribofuranosyl)aminobenzene 5'-phosphate synthase
MTTGHIAPLHLEPQQRTGLWRNCDVAPHLDDFRDDCSLVVRLAHCSMVITGCAHAGVANILCKAQTIVPDRPPQVLIGGLHLGAADDEAVTRMAREIAGLGVRAVMPCHCTGDRATQVLIERFPGKVAPIGAGSVIRVHEQGNTEVRHPRVPDGTEHR